jgi:predicted nucleic-acid-binding Zn-ribbon protein
MPFKILLYIPFLKKSLSENCQQNEIQEGKFQKNISDVQEKNFSIIHYSGNDQKNLYSNKYSYLSSVYERVILK